MTATIATLIALTAASCGGTQPSTTPQLTDPGEIIRAALASTASATSFHLDATIDGTIAISVPIGGLSGPATPVALAGSTATADVDLADTAARATFAVPTMFGLGGEVIAVDGKAYVKTTLTGTLYSESDASSAAVDPSAAGDAIDALGSVLLADGVELVKGDDVPCGSSQCYTVSARLDASELGLDVTPVSGLVDLAGATLDVTVRVEQAAPNHLAGIEAVLTTTDGNAVTVDATISKWDEPLTISAPPADQIKPPGSTWVRPGVTSTAWMNVEWGPTRRPGSGHKLGA